jgi:two-component system, OmpR family, heavy metal sensor histidine kinase CusS
MRSLRTALIAGTTIAMAAVLLAAGVLVYVLARTSLVDQTDRALVDKARLIATDVEGKEGDVVLDLAAFHIGDNESLDPRDYVQLWRTDGTVVYRSSALGGEGMERFSGSEQSPEWRWVTLPGERTGRAVGIEVRARAEDAEEKDASDTAARGATGKESLPMVTLVLARDMGPMESTLAGLRVLLGSVGCAAIAVSAGVLLLVVRRALAPLDRLAVAIGRLGEQNLSARVELSGTPRELQPVVERLNDLLGRLDAAFERERAFSADVAHELRTPLAGLRSTIDVTLSRLRQPEEYQEAMGDCLRITVQMQAMMENLISLARLEAGQVAFQVQPVRLGELVRDHWNPLAPLAAARRLQVEWALDGDGPVETDPAQFGLVVRNLLDNAVAHSDPGGQVRIATAVDGNQATLTVANSGSTVPQEQADDVFKRFWRGDAARSDTGVHCGLGLALTKKITTLLGGSVQVRSERGGEFEVAVSIPGRGEGLKAE